MIIIAHEDGGRRASGATAIAGKRHGWRLLIVRLSNIGYRIDQRRLARPRRISLDGKMDLPQSGAWAGHFIGCSQTVRSRGRAGADAGVQVGSSPRSRTSSTSRAG